MTTTDRAWAAQAACRSVPKDVFYDVTNIELAARLCFGCSVADECLEAAMREEGGSPVEDRYGYRGRMTPRERVAYRRRLNRRSLADRRKAS